MSFTNDDLKRLKKQIPNSKYGFDDIDFDLDELLALLARLEAAEQVCFGVMLAHPENETCDCSLCDLLRTWLKSKGETHE